MPILHATLHALSLCCPPCRCLLTSDAVKNCNNDDLPAGSCCNSQLKVCDGTNDDKPGTGTCAVGWDSACCPKASTQGIKNVKAADFRFPFEK